MVEICLEAAFLPYLHLSTRANWLATSLGNFHMSRSVGCLLGNIRPASAAFPVESPSKDKEQIDVDNVVPAEGKTNAMVEDPEASVEDNEDNVVLPRSPDVEEKEDTPVLSKNPAVGMKGDAVRHGKTKRSSTGAKPGGSIKKNKGQ